MIPSLQVLDMHNRDGEEFVSDLEDDEEGEYGEEGELEMDEAEE